MRSANNPKTSAPTAMPIEFILPIQPICSAVKFHSFCNAAIINESIPTSIASNNQPSPAIQSNLFLDTSLLMSSLRCQLSNCLPHDYISFFVMYQCKKRREKPTLIASLLLKTLQEEVLLLLFPAYRLSYSLK